jgi:hypothetical protein
VEGVPADFETMFAHAPTLVDAFFGVYGPLWQSQVAAPELKELLRLRAARTVDCFL